MADHTKIEWTDATWNIITGCSVVSAGCKHCYAMKLAGTRLQHHPSRAGLTQMSAAGPVWNGEVRFNEQWLDQPMRWTKPRLIFVCAHGDLFHEAVPDEWLDRVFAMMALCPRHTFQVLTKRPARMLAYLADAEMEIRDAIKYERVAHTMQWPLRNVWLGVSVEDQAAADERIPLLLKTPAAVRWISAEPLLGTVDLRHLNKDKETNELDALQPWTWEQELEQWRGSSETWEEDFADWYGGMTIAQAKGPCHPKIDWVVGGAESGNHARPTHPAWFRSLRDQCAAAGVAYLHKQNGEWLPRSSCYHTFEDGKSLADLDPGATQWPCIRITEAGNGGHDLEHAEEGDHVYMQRVGKKLAGRLLDGKQHDGYPAVTTEK